MKEAGITERPQWCSVVSPQRSPDGLSGNTVPQL